MKKIRFVAGKGHKIESFMPGSTVALSVDPTCLSLLRGPGPNLLLDHVEVYGSKAK